MHPRALGAALTHPYLTTDYSEALLEFVTPAVHTNAGLLDWLCELHAFVHRRLAGELLWPASMPCVLAPDQDIPIAEYGTSNLGMMKTVYRRGLGHRYGRAMQAIAGAHFNFSLDAPFWDAWLEREGGLADEAAAKSAAYMGLVRNFRRHGWLVVYLFGASPALCRSFRPEGGGLLEPLDEWTWHAPWATSLRMSDLGYRNKSQARLNISVNSLEEYIDGLVAAVTTVDPAYQQIGLRDADGYRQLNASVLQIENEYYSSIRPKPRKGPADRPIVTLRKEGVEYVEVRSLDLNAADPVGVNQVELRFLESLLIFCLLADSPPISPAEQRLIDARDLAVAREGRRPGLRLPTDDGERSLRALGLELVDRVGEVAELLDGPVRDYSDAVASQRDALLDPDRTPSARMLAELRRTGSGFFALMLDTARAHRDYFSSLALREDRDQELERVAADSLGQAAALEREPQPSFDDYLAAWSSPVYENM
jgi:glutamate--cysteine ligase